MELNTFSIAAHCSRTGQLGVAISTAVPACGSLSLFVEAGAGAIATQAWVNPYLGIDGLKLLASGASAEDALARLIADDPARESRQLGIVDAQGRAAAFTGSACPDWCGHIVGDGFAVQGNLLVSSETLAAMEDAFRASEGEPLAERLVRALDAGQAAGGDKRGKQSAALKVMAREAYPHLDLRVDAHADPVAELRRIYEIAKHQLLPFIGALPTRDAPMGGILSDDVIAMLLSPPAHRRER